MNNYKRESAILGMLLTFGLSKVFAQTTNESTASIVASLPATPNILYAALGQVLNNPSSTFVIAFLCVVAWMIDDTPIFPSRYIKHLCVVVGASIYWVFTSESTVPKSFPHPQAVFLVNGTICGFIAFVVHQQAVARLINLMRGNPPATQIQPALQQK
jgi:hypothetical protein